MMLLTKAIREALPPLYSQDGLGLDAVAYVKFFTPDSNWTWWASEGCALVETDEDDYKEVPLKEAGDDYLDVLFFGLVSGHERELGYFMLSELQSATGPLGLHIERDLHFKPTKLKDLP